MVQMSEYAIINKIDHKPYFAWWVKDVLCEIYCIFSKVKIRYWETTQKIEIGLPKSVPQALKIDKNNGNTFWKDEIEK